MPERTPGQEAMDQAERLTREAGAEPPREEVREIVVEQLDSDPRLIPHFLRAAREHVEGRER